jgi:DNA-binding transcriptional regulator YdaS (Cro superfamily)
MTKQQAIAMFGSGAKLARALGITRGAVSQWPDDLDQDRTDRVNGAALRLGVIGARGRAVVRPESRRVA